MQENQVTQVTTPETSISKVIIESILEKKGSEIVSLDLRKINEAITDYFIICHADSTVQVKAIADNIHQQVKEKTGVIPLHIEGLDSMEWVLLDFADVVVHVFHKSKRSFYNLEDLWHDAEREEHEDQG
jgi:ribosome-associated protein